MIEEENNIFSFNIFSNKVLTNKSLFYKVYPHQFLILRDLYRTAIYDRELNQNSVMVKDRS